MFGFVLCRIAILFSLIHAFLMIKRKYSVKKTILFEVAAFLLTTAIGIVPGVKAQGVVVVITAIISAVVFQAVTIFISEYRDFRAMLCGAMASCFPLVGVFAAVLVKYFTGSFVGAVAVQVLLDAAMVVFDALFIREPLLDSLKDKNKKWGAFWIIPTMFYCLVFLTLGSGVVVPLTRKDLLATWFTVTLMIVVTVVIRYIYHYDNRLIKNLETESRLGGTSGMIRNTAQLDQRIMKIYARGLLVMLAAILVLACAVIYMNYKPGANGKVISLEQMESEDSTIQLSISPRGGDTDTWIKQLHNGYKLCGVTYDIVVTNTGEYQLKDWSLKLIAPCEMYINSAWCGTVEIHQFRDDEKIVQELDLREFKWDELDVEYISGEKDLLVRLLPGDYIVYQPNASVSEMPIEGTSKNGKLHSVTCGMILYKDSGPFQFSEGNLTYVYEQPLVKQIPFVILMGLLTVWGAGMLFLLGYRVQKKNQYELQEKDRQLIYEIMDAFVGFVDAKDTYTAGHSNRVAEYSRLIARELNFSEAEVLQIYYSALLHDCGKISIPESILNKPGRLSDEEFEVIKSHTVRGYDILKNLSSLPTAAIAARSHHERFDGTGYPDGKKGDEIPLLARIVSIADSFDAMNYSRVYRPHLNREQILHELKSNSGTQFDPALVKVFIRLIEEGQVYVYSGKE